MNATDPSLLLMIEAAAPFFILSIVLALALMSGRKKMKKAAKQLILDVKSNDKNDRDEVKKFLEEKFNLDKKQVNKASKKILNERKFLLRNIISGILDKNLEAISMLNQDLNRVCKQYHQLELAAPEPIVEVVEEIQVEEKPVEDKSKELKKEIKGLKQEVHITLTTLNNIFKEFSSMFGENIPDSDMSVEQIITAMEAFSNKGSASATENETSDDANETLLTNSETDIAKDREISEQAGENISLSEETDSNQVVEEPLEEVLPDESSISEQLDDILGEDDSISDLDFSVVDESDDIDGALDMLELDSTDDEEPDWGDAFAESGDVMEEEEKS